MNNIAHEPQLGMSWYAHFVRGRTTRDLIPSESETMNRNVSSTSQAMVPRPIQPPLHTVSPSRNRSFQRLKQSALILAGGSCAALAMWLTHVAMQPITPVPDLAPVPQVYEAGAVRQSSVRAEFELWNRTDETINIAHVIQTCRCTVTTIHKKELAPGGNTKLSSTWDTTGLRGASASGLEVYYTIGNRPGLKSVQLLIEADVVPEFEYTPPLLTFSAGESALTKSIVQFTAHPASTRNVKVLNVMSSHPAFRAEKRSDRSVEVTFVSSEYPDDPHLRPKLTITTDCPTERVVEIPLRVRPVQPK